MTIPPDSYLYRSLKFFHTVANRVRLMHHLKDGIPDRRLMQEIVYSHNAQIIDIWNNESRSLGCGNI